MEDLWLQPSRKAFDEAWADIHARKAPASSALLKERLLYDPRLGLGVMARAYLLRDIFKTELLRHRQRTPLGRDAGWHLLLPNDHVNSLLFSSRALDWQAEAPFGAYLAQVKDALNDPAWHARLCEGDAARGVGGLNQWFGPRYARNLVGGAMNAERLFSTRFFGRSAPANFTHYVLTGQYLPGLGESQPEAAPLDAEDPHGLRLRAFCAELAGADNGGRPIAAVNCRHSPALLTRAAATIVDQLQDSGKAVCYVPLAKGQDGGAARDAGFRSIVRMIHRFISGLPLGGGGAPADESDEDVRERVEEIRRFLVTQASVIVLDGYRPPPGPYPALVGFVRDEPLSRLLRLLQQPTVDAAAYGGLQNFRGCYFVVLGEDSRDLLAVHQSLALDLDGVAPAAGHSLEALQALGLRHPEEVLRVASPAMRADWQLRLLDFLAVHGSLPANRRGSDSRHPDSLANDFRNGYWVGLEGWQRVFLSALSLSETGLRWTTVAQLFDAYARLQAHGVCGIEQLSSPLPNPEQFKRFLDSLAPPAPPDGSRRPTGLLLRYRDSAEVEITEAGASPSQAVTALTPTHPWMLVRGQRSVREAQTYDFVDPEVKQLVAQFMPPWETLLLRRILAELSLQAFRIGLRNDPAPHRRARRMTRLLLETVLHGFLSIEAPAAGRGRQAVLPSYSIGEIPSRPMDAYAFMYFTVLKELLCAGDLATLGRTQGAGGLELELLTFVAAPREPDASQPHAFERLGELVQAPAWFVHFQEPLRADAARRAATEHLLALARCARRATRLEILAHALKKLSALSPDVPNRVDFQKFQIDLSMRWWINDEWGQSNFEGLMRAATRALAADLHARWAPRGGGAGRQAANPEGLRRVERLALCLNATVDKLTRDVARRAPGLWAMRPAAARPQAGARAAQKAPLYELDDLVQRTVERVNRQLRGADIGPDGLAVLARFGIFHVHVAEGQLRLGGQDAAIGSFLSAVSVFWLVKALAFQRVRRDPYAAASRIGAPVADAFLRAFEGLSSIAASGRGEHAPVPQPAGRKERVSPLIQRLQASARSTLDTFIREQGHDTADRIVARILESAYARCLLPSADGREPLPEAAPAPAAAGRGRKGEHAPPPAIDLPTRRGLATLGTCLRWLRDAEWEMLPITSRPSLRFMLCVERLNCNIALLAHLRLLQPAQMAQARAEGAAEPHATLDWIANDLKQISIFLVLLQAQQVEPKLDAEHWRSLFDRHRREVRQWLPRWQQAWPQQPAQAAIGHLRGVLQAEKPDR